MKTKEARKLINWDEAEEITNEEFNERDCIGEGEIFCEDGRLYFRPKKKVCKECGSVLK